MYISLEKCKRGGKSKEWSVINGNRPIVWVYLSHCGGSQETYVSKQSLVIYVCVCVYSFKHLLISEPSAAYMNSQNKVCGLLWTC